jgi:RimJ/RimL family protein N-acetyltransferase
MVADLARCELLADASPEDLWRLADLLTPVSAAAGVVLMAPGDVTDGFLFVTRGRVGVAADHEPPGRKEFLVPAGSVVGELALLGRAHRATVTAHTEVHCLMGGRPAAVRLLGIRGARERVIRLARHRLAANLVPVPLRLLDGATVWLRPVVPEDGNAVLGHRGRSSNETLYRRFFRSGQPSRRDLAYLADADYVDHFAWVALDEAGVPVGEASYFRAPDGTDAEVSFWLPDDFQGRGLGTLLVGALAVAARRNGVARFAADVLGENARARAMLERAGLRWTPERSGVVHGVAAVPDPSLLGIPPADGRGSRGLGGRGRHVW